MPSSSDDYSRNSGCEQRQSGSRPPPIPLDAKILSSPAANEDGRQDNDEEDVSPVNNKSLPFLKGEQDNKSKPTSTKEIDANSFQKLDSLHSINVLAGLSIPTEPTSSIKQINLAAGIVCSEQPSLATPPRTPMPFVTPADVSRTFLQRPVIAPTPVRASSAKLNSPAKFSLKADDIYRTPAQRVPIETVLARGTSSFQKTAQLGSNRSRSGPSLTTRTPVFTRPALDSPSRSPAKRVPITDLVASPTRGHQSSPTRLGIRARSASVDPRPLGTTLARSRSVEPCATTSKLDNHAKVQESIFPMGPALPRVAPKLPFPLVPSKKSSSDLPSPIPEEHEGTEAGNTENDGTPGRVTSGKTTSQLRQPSTSSRIPRIGNKPYARPQKAGKVIVGTTTTNTTRAPVSSSLNVLDAYPLIFITESTTISTCLQE